MYPVFMVGGERKSLIDTFDDGHTRIAMTFTERDSTFGGLQVVYTFWCWRGGVLEYAYHNIAEPIGKRGW